MTTSDIHPEDSARLASLPSDRVSFVRIGPDADGQRLDNFLVRVAKGVPKSHIYRIIRSGEVRVNKARAKAETRLAEGDLLSFRPCASPSAPSRRRRPRLGRGDGARSL